jgi:hypothetical protein
MHSTTPNKGGHHDKRVFCGRAPPFLKFLAASPYVASLGGIAAFLQEDGFAQDMREIRESSFASSVAIA